MLLGRIDNHQSAADASHIVRDVAMAHHAVVLHAHAPAVAVDDADAEGLALVDVTVFHRSATVHIHTTTAP